MTYKIKMKDCYAKLIIFPTNPEQRYMQPNGIFSDLAYGFNDSLPWRNEELYDTPFYINNEDLDTAYYYRSGEKTVIPLLADNCRLDNQLNPLNTRVRQQISKMLYAKYSAKWIKEFNTMLYEYNPIENYRMVESETIDKHDEGSNSDTGTISRDADNEKTNTGTLATQNNLTESDTGTISRDADNEKINTGTLTTQNNLTESNTGTLTKDFDNLQSTTESVTLTTSDTNVNSVWGFNSSNDVDSDKQIGSGTSNQSKDGSVEENNKHIETHNLTKTNTGTVTETHNLTDSETVDETETRNLASTNELDSTIERDLTRSGNIGVTTSQQLITSERELWLWEYFEMVFDDVDKALCLDVYDYSESEI